MSSTTTTGNATTSAATTTAVERQTYWCHECDMSISLLTPPAAATTTSPLLCPYCHSDFLEEMDSPHPLTTTTTTLPPPETLIPTTTSDDNYLLDSPHFHRLIHHLSDSEPDDFPPSAAARHRSPTSKSAVESIPAVMITASLLDLDPIILCAVCKDQFVIGVEAKQLPCSHMYHPDCILPWLAQHSSCPVCRYQMPVEAAPARERRRSRFVGGLMEGEGEGEELTGLRSTLSYIARRHNLVFPGGEAELSRLESFLFSHRRVGEAEPRSAERASSAETVSSWPVERASSVEAVSSWPGWPVEGGVGGAGGGDGETSVSSRVIDDGDAVMSGARASGHVSTNLKYCLISLAYRIS